MFRPALSAWLLVAVGISLLACNPRIDRARAGALAAARLKEFARDQELKVDLFTKGEVQESKENWLYSFDYPAAPRQAVAIIVSKRGIVEVSRMLDANR